MDSYPSVTVSERECASRHPSNSSKASTTISSHEGQHAPTLRNDSAQSEASITLAAEYLHYTDAPPPYSEKQYEGKSEEQQNKMRMADYAKEINRQMGKQLVTGLKSGETKVE